MKIFFDLDGTLLDSKERLYLLFQKLIPNSDLTFDDYWNLKKSKIGHNEILKKKYSFSDQQISAFQTLWMKNIELEEWLIYDKPFDGITDYLMRLKDRHNLYVVTARQFEEVAYAQIKRSGWDGIFEKIFVTCQKNEKSDLISDAKLELKSTDWFVGSVRNTCPSLSR